MDSPAGPIKICFVVLKAYPLFNPDAQGNFGGAEVDSYLLATELAKDDNFAVSFIVADYGQEPVEIRDGITIIKSLDFSKNLIFAPWKLFCALRKADASIYFRKMSSLVTSVVVLYCKCYKKLFVYRTADTDECDGTYLRQHWFRGRAFAWSLRSAKAVFTQNVTGSEALLANTGISATAVGNAHRLPPVEQHHPDTILWVGRSAAVKRADLFLKLAKQSPGQQFTMVCQRSTGDDRYEDLVQQAEKIENLNFVRHVPFREIDEYFQRAKVLVNTSDSEGFPNTFIQACKCLTPILSLNVNPDKFLDNYNCGFSCDGDWDKLLESLKIVLEAEHNAELGKNARKYVEENHDITKIVEQYKSCFIRIRRQHSKRKR